MSNFIIRDFYRGVRGGILTQFPVRNVVMANGGSDGIFKTFP